MMMQAADDDASAGAEAETTLSFGRNIVAITTVYILARGRALDRSW